MYSRNEIELMSPVGSFESLVAAEQGGADAVYFGVGNLNMRSQSTINFSFDDLSEISSFCKNKGIKTYLTINSVIYDDEVAMMKKMVDEAKKNDISAIIATDHAVINYARQQDIEIHGSTQLNISNTEAVNFYSNYCDVMVLARELDLPKVKAISDQIIKQNITGPSGQPVKLEMFVHGALCMSISGKCYLSLHEQNYSANRGACLQPCRKSYIVKDKETDEELEIENEHIMSPKDLCAIHFLNKIIDAGVTILKIEGRARSPEYVKTVTSCYNEAINAIIEGSYSQKKIDDWMKRLSTVFNRGFWNGYYLGQRLGEWSNVYGSKATRKKVYVGKVSNYFTNIKVAEVKMETGSLSLGEKVLIIGPTTGVLEETINEIRVNHINVDKTKKGDICSIPVDTFLRRSDKIYKWIER